MEKNGSKAWYIIIGSEIRTVFGNAKPIEYKFLVFETLKMRISVHP